MNGLILIAGATGYIGGELLKKLLAAGCTVRRLARRPEALRARALAGLEVVEGDVLHCESVRAAMLLQLEGETAGNPTTLQHDRVLHLEG